MGPNYDQALVQRGDITLWISEDAIEGWKPAPCGGYEIAPTYAGSVARRCPNITKAIRELGYAPTVQWRDGVRKTIDWYRDYLSKNPILTESFYDKGG